MCIRCIIHVEWNCSIRATHFSELLWPLLRGGHSLVKIKACIDDLWGWPLFRGGGHYWGVSLYLLHMYYMCSTHVLQVHELHVKYTKNPTHVLRMYTCIWKDILTKELKSKISFPDLKNIEGGTDSLCSCPPLPHRHTPPPSLSIHPPWLMNSKLCLRRDRIKINK